MSIEEKFEKIESFFPNFLTIAKIGRGPNDSSPEKPFREEACLVPWQIWRLENLTDKLTSRKFAKLWNREKMKQISFERYIWMIAKTEIANDSKIRLRFENLTGKKTIRKFVICQ